MIIDYVQTVFKEIKFDDFTVDGINWQVKNMRFHTVDIAVHDLDVWLDGDLMKVRMRDAGGSFTGDTYSPKMWPASGWNHMGFDFHADKGGFKKIEFDLGVTKQFVDGRTLPSIDVKWANFEFDHNRMRLDIQSDDWLAQAGGFLANTFKDTYLFCLKPILNMSFP
jgi:hypothetical protein